MNNLKGITVVAVIAIAMATEMSQLFAASITVSPAVIAYKKDVIVKGKLTWENSEYISASVASSDTKIATIQVTSNSSGNMKFDVKFKKAGIVTVSASFSKKSEDTPDSEVPTYCPPVTATAVKLESIIAWDGDSRHSSATLLQTVPTSSNEDLNAKAKFYPEVDESELPEKFPFWVYGFKNEQFREYGSTVSFSNGLKGWFYPKKRIKDARIASNLVCNDEFTITAEMYPYNSAVIKKDYKLNNTLTKLAIMGVKKLTNIRLKMPEVKTKKIDQWKEQSNTYKAKCTYVAQIAIIVKPQHANIPIGTKLVKKIRSTLGKGVKGSQTGKEIVKNLDMGFNLDLKVGGGLKGTYSIDEYGKKNHKGEGSLKWSVEGNSELSLPSSISSLVQLTGSVGVGTGAALVFFDPTCDENGIYYDVLEKHDGIYYTYALSASLMEKPLFAPIEGKKFIGLKPYEDYYDIQLWSF